jgi:hypothetical protein
MLFKSDRFLSDFHSTDENVKSYNFGKGIHNIHIENSEMHMKFYLTSSCLQHFLKTKMY